MKRKVDSSESQKDGTIDIEQNSNSFKNNRLEFTERKTKKKIPHISNRLSTQHGKTSAFSSASKINSYLKGQSVSEPDQFKSNDSTFFNQLAQKYVPRGTSRQKMRQQMQLALQRKRSQIEALRVHRDELKFISYNNPYDIPIKISLAVLKEKAKMEEKIKDYKMILKKDIKELDSEFNMMTDYFNYVTNALKAKGQEDLIIDTQEEQKLMIENLQKENNHLFRELKEQDKKNAKQIKNMQEQIALLRVFIKQKQDKIRDLKSKICFLHIKLHSRSSNSKEKSMSMSIRKFNSDQHSAVQEAFIGNSSFKSFSKEIIQKVQSTHQFTKIKFYYDKKRQLLTFRCIYRKSEGRIHDYRQDIYATENGQFKSPSKDRQEKAIQIRTKYVLSCKFFFKSRIVGVQCRLKSQKGTENIQIGNCSSNLEHQLLTLVNKRMVTLSSYWHQKDMIGVGVWYCLRREHSQKGQLQKQQVKKESLKMARSANKLNTDYYN